MYNITCVKLNASSPQGFCSSRYSYPLFTHCEEFPDDPIAITILVTMTAYHTVIIDWSLGVKSPGYWNIERPLSITSNQCGTELSRTFDISIICKCSVRFHRRQRSTPMRDILTHVPMDKMAAISQEIFSDAFSGMKSSVFWLKFHWSLFRRVQLTISQHWFR